jgi:16S rRNA (uracil1498-N3)-methyltransferase
VEVQVEVRDDIDRELPLDVTLAVGMPANERMDWLIEKATELGAARIQPLVCERSVLRLAGERAIRKVEHWHGVAIAAAEQSGRTRLPVIEPVRTLREWVPGTLADPSIRRLLLSLQEASPLSRVAVTPGTVCFLSGPEGGLTSSEEALAREAGFEAVTLGPRVLRAETAPLAALACLGASIQPTLLPECAT